MTTFDPQIEIHPPIAKRRSPRAFDPERAVSEDAVLTMLEAARWAPSSRNSQPWRFIVGFKGDKIHRQICKVLSDGNRLWAQHAPLLVLTVAQEQGERGPMRYAWHDLGLATAQLILQASVRGLYAHIMAGFSKEDARATFDIPSDFAPVTTIAIGYLGDVAMLPENLQKRENAPRSRKPLFEIAFQESWGKPLNL